MSASDKKRVFLVHKERPGTKKALFVWEGSSTDDLFHQARKSLQDKKLASVWHAGLEVGAAELCVLPAGAELCFSRQQASKDLTRPRADPPSSTPSAAAAQPSPSSVTICVPCSRAVAGRIIGKDGQAMEGLMAKTGASHIRFDAATEQMVIRGSEGACRVAARLIAPAFAGFVRIPTASAGRVIGKKGSNITAIREKTKAMHIDIVSREGSAARRGPRGVKEGGCGRGKEPGTSYVVIQGPSKAAVCTAACSVLRRSVDTTVEPQFREATSDSEALLCHMLQRRTAQAGDGEVSANLTEPPKTRDDSSWLDETLPRGVEEAVQRMLSENEGPKARQALLEAAHRKYVRSDEEGMAAVLGSLPAHLERFDPCAMSFEVWRYQLACLSVMQSNA